MTGAEGKLMIGAAGAVVKTTDGVVKLFFASQIERLKANLREKFVEKQISNKNIERIFEAYLISLYHKCNTVNTIIFPQNEIPLEKIYEPLILIPDNNLFSAKLTIDETKKYVDLIIHDELKKNILLIDVAGMGKSTFSKHLVLKILKNTLHSKIPIFIELRKILQEESLIQHILKEINLEYKNILTEEMLLKLMEKGRFLFIFDGFDEVDDDRELLIGNEISDLSTTFLNNTVILTSRNRAYIPTIHNQVTFNFKHLDLGQIKSLLLRYDASVDIEVGKDLIKHENFKTLNYELFGTPLMVNLLYMSFGHNKTIDSNIVTFYDEMFNALYKGHDLTKAGFSRPKYSKLNFENFKSLFNAFCFVSLFENKISFSTKGEVLNTIKKAATLSSIEVHSFESFFGDLLNNVPFLTKDGLEFKFMHKTIIEFFAAEFMNYSEVTSALVKKIEKNNLLVSFIKSFDFLYQINSSLYIKEIGHKFLSEYMHFIEHNYQEFNEYFKTILFFNDDAILTVETKEDEENNHGVYGGYTNQMGYFFDYEDAQYLISISYNQTSKFKHIPKAFLQDILIIDNNTSTNSLMDKKLNAKDLQYNFSHLELGKHYPINLDTSDLLQSSKLITALLLRTLIYDGHLREEENTLFHINKNKCQNILSASVKKLDVLD